MAESAEKLKEKLIKEINYVFDILEDIKTHKSSIEVTIYARKYADALRVDDTYVFVKYDLSNLYAYPDGHMEFTLTSHAESNLFNMHLSNCTRQTCIDALSNHVPVSELMPTGLFRMRSEIPEYIPMGKSGKTYIGTDKNGIPLYTGDRCVFGIINADNRVEPLFGTIEYDEDVYAYVFKTKSSTTPCIMLNAVCPDSIMKINE